EMFTGTHVDGVAGDETLDVTAFGTTQRYYHIKDIFAEAGSGNDTIILQQSDKTHKGVLSPATLHGGMGDDNLTAGDGPATLKGGFGNDTLTGGPSDDLIYGDGGIDLITGAGGNNRLVGGFSFSGGDDGADLIIGGDGNDLMAGDNANLDDGANPQIF